MPVMTIKFVNNPKPNSRFGSIVDTGGTRYPCPAGLMSGFQQGQTYDVPTKSENWTSGPVIVVAGPPQPTAAPQQAATAAGHNGGGQGDTTQAAIFITGIVGRAIGSGKFDTQDIPLLAKAALAAWNEVKGQL